jgi:ketosteroid isomerase-like protein
MGIQSSDTLSETTYSVVEQFNVAFNTCDIDAIMALMTEHCVFENTSPAPDGERFEGQAAVRAAWEQFFGSSNNPTFHTEEMFAYGDRAVVRWRYTWNGTDNTLGHVRGVDVFRVEDGKVAEKLAYVKG